MSSIRKTLALLSLLLLSGCGKDSWFGGEKKLDMPGERLPLERDLLDTTHTTAAKPHIHAHATPQTQTVGFTIHFDAHNSNLAWNENAQPQLKLSTYAPGALNNAPGYVIHNDIIWYSLGDGTIKAYSITTGEEKWSSEFYTIKFNNGFKALFADSPINVYMNIQDDILYTVADVGYYASFDANTGEVLATKELSAPSRSVPNIMGNNVVIQTADGKMVALNRADGRNAWSFDSSHIEMQSIEQIKLLDLGYDVAAKFSNNEVALLNSQNGMEIWTLPLERYGATRKTSRNLNNLNQMYAHEGFMYVVSNAGKLVKIGQGDGEANIVYSKAYNIEGRIWIVDNAILAMSDNDNLLCINAHNGELHWRIALRDLVLPDDQERIPEFMDPVVINGKVSVLTSDGMLLNFDIADGNLASQATLDIDAVLSAPTVYQDRLVVSSAKYGIVVY